MMPPLPPYAATFRIGFDPDAEGVLLMPFTASVVGRAGFLHGGAIAGLLELAAIIALRTALAAEGGGEIAPITQTIDYMRGGREKPTRARGEVVRLGRRVANVTATTWQDDSAQPVASARLTFALGR